MDSTNKQAALASRVPALQVYPLAHVPDLLHLGPWAYGSSKRIDKYVKSGMGVLLTSVMSLSLHNGYSEAVSLDYTLELPPLTAHGESQLTVKV